MRHVGSPLFAVIVCRKFATAAAFSWHLPHHKNAAAMNRRQAVPRSVAPIAIGAMSPDIRRLPDGPDQLHRDSAVSLGGEVNMVSL
jgi:hypothetical protein